MRSRSCFQGGHALRALGRRGNWSRLIPRPPPRRDPSSTTLLQSVKSELTLTLGILCTVEQQQAMGLRPVAALSRRTLRLRDLPHPLRTVRLVSAARRPSSSYRYELLIRTLTALQSRVTHLPRAHRPQSVALAVTEEEGTASSNTVSPSSSTASLRSTSSSTVSRPSSSTVSRLSSSSTVNRPSSRLRARPAPVASRSKTFSSCSSLRCRTRSVLALFVAFFEPAFCRGSPDCPFELGLPAVGVRSRSTR